MLTARGKNSRKSKQRDKCRKNNNRFKKLKLKKRKERKNRYAKLNRSR